jgi:hypothetical protein
MSEEFLERLSRFTPDARGLDRDALLFAAGRASVRPNRGWMTLATAMTCSQVLSLVLLWPRPSPPEGRLTVATAIDPIPSAAATGEPGTTNESASSGTWSTRHKLLDSEPDDVPDDTVSLIESGPPLKVFGPRPSSLVN